MVRCVCLKLKFDITLEMNVTLFFFLVGSSRDLEKSFNQPLASREDCKENKIKLTHKLDY